MRWLSLAFRYSWSPSDAYGFVRQSEIENLGERRRAVDFIDGLQNILPAGTPRFAQTNTSNLVDAYKWNELVEDAGLGLFTLGAEITDRAEPCESLKATTVFSLGLSGHKVLLSGSQLEDFRQGASLTQEVHTRGTRGDYLVNASMDPEPQPTERSQIVAHVEQSQAEVVSLLHELRDPPAVTAPD